MNRPRPKSPQSRSPARPADLGRVHELDGQGLHEEAIVALRAMAGRGEMAAAAYLGVRLLLGRGAPIAPTEGVRLLASAARAGEVDALLAMANLCATGEHVAQSWAAALLHLARAAERGSERAQGQLRLLAGEDDGTDWKARARRVDPAAWTAAPATEVLRERPRMEIARSFLPASCCDWLMQRAGPLLRPAEVYDQASGGKRPDERRTGASALFDLLSTDVVISLVRARIAALATTSPERLEATQVLHYQAGQAFHLHFDFLSLTGGGFAAAEAGQRVATALVYLNDDYGAGETSFPRLHLDHRGAKGDLLLFYNVDGEGRPDPLTLHAGTPPSAGEKWVLSQWIRGQTGR